MVLSTCDMHVKNLSEADHHQMTEYLRSKEYICGMRDALTIIDHCNDLSEAIKEIEIVLGYCEEMKYSIIKEVFCLQKRV